MFGKEDLLKLKKDALVATAQLHQVDITQCKTNEDIADKIMEELGKQKLPEKKVEGSPRKSAKPAGRKEVIDYLRSVDGIDVIFPEKEENVVYLRVGKRETCMNIAQPLDAIKRCVEVFRISLPHSVEAALAR